MGNYYVYILSNKTNSTLYVGVTNNLERRIYEHKAKTINGFSSKYNLNKLVYFECYSQIDDAINREKQLKGWRRIKKNELIFGMNPLLDDLAKEWFSE